MIEIEALTKRFTRNIGNPSLWRRVLSRPETEPVTAIDELDLHVGRGEFVSLLGPNGAGKTSIVRVLCTLLLPDEGRCRVAGYDVETQQREVRRSIGVSIRGERSVYWKLTGRQNLSYFARLYGIRGQSAGSRIDEIAEVVGLTERIDDYVERYSMGMKQRLAIGVSLVHEPSVLLLDEPTIGLDPNGARSLRLLLKELSRDKGVTILYTTHYLQEAEDLSDRVAIINHGRKIIEGSPDQVRGALGDNRIIEIQLGAEAGNAIAALGDHSLVDEILAVDCQPTITTVRLRTSSPVNSVTVLAAGIDGLKEHDVLGIQLVRPTLEDVFVSLTGSHIATSKNSNDHESTSG